MVVILLNAIYDEEKIKNIDIRKMSLGAALLYILSVTWVLYS